MTRLYLNNIAIPFTFKDNYASQTLVIIHGHNDSHEIANYFTDSNNNFNVLSFSLPGARDNYFRPDEITFAKIVNFATQVIKKKVHNSSIILLGHSFGGMVIPFVASRLKKVKKVIYINPIHPHFYKTKTFKTLAEVLKPEENSPLSLKVRTGLRKHFVPSELQEFFGDFLNHSSPWFEVTFKTFLKKSFLTGLLLEAFVEVNNRAIYINSENDTVIGTEIYYDFVAETLQNQPIVIGQGHKPFITSKTLINNFLNEQFPFKKRFLPRLRKIVY